LGESSNELYTWISSEISRIGYPSIGCGKKLIDLWGIQVLRIGDWKTLDEIAGGSSKSSRKSEE
jgi:hypothetical protein